jgi:hypothetical protein
MIRQKQAYLKNVNDIIPHFVRSESTLANILLNFFFGQECPPPPLSCPVQQGPLLKNNCKSGTGQTHECADIQSITSTINDSENHNALQRYLKLFETHGVWKMSRSLYVKDNFT